MSGATRRAAQSLLALVIAVLLLLGGPALSARLQADKVDAASATGKDIAGTVGPPVIPEPTTPVADVPPAVDVTPLPVAPLDLQPTPPPAPSASFVSVDTTTRAAVVVDPETDQLEEARSVLANLQGVSNLATIIVATISLGSVQAEIAAVDPEEFRPFTPEATANSEGLWERIAAGDLALTHEFASDNGLVLGQGLETGSAAGQPATSLRVGAFATNGTPPIADAIVSTAEAVLLGDDTITRILVGLDREASPRATVEALAEAGLAAQEIPDPRAPATQVTIPQGGITPQNVWDHLALCESSGDWHINTGNGYYGGIQFLPESWAYVGGVGLPHENTKEEQIYRGTLLWQVQGWEAWPQCARKLGLIVDPPPNTEIPAPPSGSS